MLEEDKLAKSDADIIEEAKEFRRACLDANDSNIQDEKSDLNFLEGGDKQWDDAEVQSRRASGRPVITVNKLPTFIHQITNDNLQNTPSIKVHPVDDGADIEVAEVLGGLIRHIEYASNADIAYDRAVNSAVAIGRGYFRLITDYCDDESFDQDIKFCSIPNVFTVHFDHASTDIDGSDAMRVLIESRISKIDFKREYPKAKGDYSNFFDHDWVREREVLIGEYYRVEFEADTLLLLSNGEKGFESDLVELPYGVTVVKKRTVQKRKVMLYKMTALDILERTEIKCHWIPVFPVYGDVLNNDGKIIRKGIIRDAKVPCKMYNFYWTSATEEIGSRSRTPWVMAEGQDEGYEIQWRNANRSTLGVLKYKPTTFQGQLVPAPQRQPMADFPSGMMAMAMHANDDIKATTGLFDSSLGARGNATSGRQEIAQQAQGDLANFHFADNLNKTIRHCGRCLVDMIPSYYDSPRIVRTLGVDGEIKYSPINHPLPNPEIDEITGAIKTVLNDVTVGTYGVTISTGPSYQTQRQESAEAMTEMARSYPPLMQAAGDLVVKAFDWPGADEISERLKRTIPPEIVGKEDEEQQQIPPDLMQAMQQDHQQMQMLQQQLAEMQKIIDEKEQELNVKREEIASKERIAMLNADTQKDVEELKGVVELLRAQIPPPPALVADVNEDLAEES